MRAQRRALGRLACVALVLWGCGRDSARAPDAEASLANGAVEQALTERPDESAVSGSASRRPASGDDTIEAPELGAEPPLPWLSQHHVGAAVRAQHEAFSACQALADIEAPRRDGAVTVGWLVETSGRAQSVRVTTSTFDSPRVNECVLEAARRVRFPASQTRAEVAWTVRFRATARGPVAAAKRGSAGPRQRP